MFSEEIFNSLHQRRASSEKDSNNNSTLPTTKVKASTTAQKPIEGVLKERKNVVNFSIDAPKTEAVNPGVQTLKRKRDAKSPSARVTVESPSSDATSRKQSQTTATILVSKSKTKTGLPLLLKK